MPNLPSILQPGRSTASCTEKTRLSFENAGNQTPSSSGLFPLLADGQVIALLGVVSDQPGFFNDEKTTRLRAYCRLAASSLSYAQLYAEAQRRLEQVQVVREIDLAILSTLT